MTNRSPYGNFYRMVAKLLGWWRKYGLYLIWLQALVATLGSLFFSEVMKFLPCLLCWYQRICMYPLVIILAVGILKKDRAMTWYALPLATVGWLIAVYHCLLYYQLIPESLAPCIQGVSCSTKYIEWFGFITIPLLSLLAFSFIIVGLWLHHLATQRRYDH